MSHPPAEFPFWVNSSVHSTPPWVTCSDKPSCRHTICCGIVGLALAWGEIAKFTTLFAHPQLAPATWKLKTTHHAAHSGMRIPYQSPRVFCAPLECPCGALSSASPNLHHVHQANSQSPHICTLA